MKLSIIIPTLNEAQCLSRLLPLVVNQGAEVIVVDGGSTDSTLEIARGFPVHLVQAAQGRSLQMNAGAAVATGEILWFLHADSAPPPDWHQQILRAFSNPKVVGGAFRSVIDAPGLRYRLLDVWGVLRAFLGRSLYGDQGIFVRREGFQALGGYAACDPLEALDLSTRLSRTGKLRILSAPLKTSARRWQTCGFWRTVLEHSRLALRSSALGPLGLDHSRGPIWVIIMAKAPIPGKVKTRLCPPLTPGQAAGLALQLLRGTMTLVQGLPGVHPVMAVDGPQGWVKDLLGASLPVIPQGKGDLGGRLSEVFRQAFAQGAKGVIVLGADHPSLPQAYLLQAIDLLQQEADRVVLGPSEDGGYYLVGLTRPHPELFEGIPWSTPQVLQATLEQVRQMGLTVASLPSWYDVDRPEDLIRLAVRPSLIHQPGSSQPAGSTPPG